MADDKEVQVPIKSSFDPSGTNAAKSALDEVKGAAAETGQEAKKLGEIFLELAEALGVIVVLEQLVDFLGDAAKEFYENEKAVRGVSNALQSLNVDVPKVTKEVEEWAESLGRLSGFSNDELMRAVGQQITLTGSVSQAYSRVGLASDYATAKGVSFAEGISVVNAAIHGQTRALVGMIPGVTRHTEASEAQRKAIEYLEKNIRGATNSISDNAKAAAQAEERWKQFKEMIGGSVAPVITQFREVLMTIPQTLTLISDLAVERFDSVKRNIAAIAHFAKNVWQDPIAAVKAYGAERMADEVVTAQKIREVYERNKREFAANEAAKTDIARNSSKERITGDKFEQKVEYEHYESDWKAFNASLDRKFRAQLQYTKNVAKMREQTLSDVLRAFGIEEEAEKINHSKAMELLRARQRANKEAAKQELEMQVAIANQTVALASSLFGDSKELAIASAIINTYEGATKALAQTGVYGTVLAAVIIAAGLAQIAKIESTEPAKGGDYTAGAGFDDPANDEMAVRGGRRWAADMIGKWSQGVDQGWAEGMRGGTRVTNTYNQQRSVSINASIQDPSNIENAKKLLRTLKLVDSQYLGPTSVSKRS